MYTCAETFDAKWVRNVPEIHALRHCGATYCWQK